MAEQDISTIETIKRGNTTGAQPVGREFSSESGERVLRITWDDFSDDDTGVELEVLNNVVDIVFEYTLDSGTGTFTVQGTNNDTWHDLTENGSAIALSASGSAQPDSLPLLVRWEISGSSSPAGTVVAVIRFK